MVDSHKTGRMSVAEILRSFGYQVGKAANGERALDALREVLRVGAPYQTALIGRHMAGMVGETLVDSDRISWEKLKFVGGG